MSSAPFSPGSRQDISQRVASYNEVLTQRENQTKVRMEELRYQLYEDEMRECTFRPQITEVANKLSYYPPSAVPQPDEESHSIDGSVDSGLSLPAYERLYQQKNKIPKSILEKRHPTREERELEGCTFAPHIYRPKSVPGMRKDETTTTVKPLYSKSKEGDSDSEETYQKLNEISTKNSIIELMRERQQSQSPQEAESVKPLPSQPKGYAESVQRSYFYPSYNNSIRIRNALEKRKQKELEEAKVFEFNEERYLKHKQELATEGCKPFK